MQNESTFTVMWCPPNTTAYTAHSTGLGDEVKSCVSRVQAEHGAAQLNRETRGATGAYKVMAR